jgi:hypothetical protein
MEGELASWPRRKRYRQGEYSAPSAIEIARQTPWKSGLAVICQGAQLGYNACLDAYAWEMQRTDEEGGENLLFSHEALRLAQEAVRAFPGYFRFWREGIILVDMNDVHEVVRNLRIYGGRDGWNMAGRTTRCL